MVSHDNVKTGLSPPNLQCSASLELKLNGGKLYVPFSETVPAVPKWTELQLTLNQLFNAPDARGGEGKHE